MFWRNWCRTSDALLHHRTCIGSCARASHTLAPPRGRRTDRTPTYGANDASYLGEELIHVHSDPAGLTVRTARGRSNPRMCRWARFQPTFQKCVSADGDSEHDGPRQEGLRPPSCSLFHGFLPNSEGRTSRRFRSSLRASAASPRPENRTNVRRPKRNRRGNFEASVGSVGGEQTWSSSSASRTPPAATEEEERRAGTSGTWPRSPTGVAHDHRGCAIPRDVTRFPQVREQTPG